MANTKWPIVRRLLLGSGEAMDLIASDNGTVALCLGQAGEYLVALLSFDDLATLGALATEVAATASAAAADERAQALADTPTPTTLEPLG